MSPAALLGRRGALSAGKQSYKDLVLSHPNLKSYYRLNDASGGGGAAIVDQKAAQAAQVVGSVLAQQTGLITGDADKSIKCADVSDNGTGGFRLNTNGVYMFPNNVSVAPFTFELWAKWSSFGGGSYLLSCPNWHLVQNGGNANLVVYSSAFAELANSGNGVLTAGNTYNVGVTFASDAKFRLYLNGVLKVTSAAVAAWSDVSAPQYFGVRNNGNNSFGHKGFIDECAVYDTDLSAATLLAHYNRGIVA